MLRTRENPVRMISPVGKARKKRALRLNKHKVWADIVTFRVVGTGLWGSSYQGRQPHSGGKIWMKMRSPNLCFGKLSLRDVK